MKISPWDIISIVLLALTGCMLLGFVTILVDPQTPLNLFPPPDVPTKVVLPTATATFRQIPPTWTPTKADVQPGSGLKPTSTIPPTSTEWKVPTFTSTPTNTMTPTKTRTPTRTPTRTNTPDYNATFQAITSEAQVKTNVAATSVSATQTAAARPPGPP